MKKMIAILAAVMLFWGASASADTLDFLKPFWMQMMDGVSNTASGKIPENVTVTCTDERLTVEACGVLLENDYSAEAHVYAVLKNTVESRDNVFEQVSKPQVLLFTIKKKYKDVSLEQTVKERDKTVFRFKKGTDIDLLITMTKNGGNWQIVDISGFDLLSEKNARYLIHAVKN